jgi:hypothetical protein
MVAVRSIRQECGGRCSRRCRFESFDPIADLSAKFGKWSPTADERQEHDFFRDCAGAGSIETKLGDRSYVVRLLQVLAATVPIAYLLLLFVDTVSLLESTRSTNQTNYSYRIATRRESLLRVRTESYIAHRISCLDSITWDSIDQRSIHDLM